MLNDRIFRRAFILSSIGHFLCLALIGNSINSPPKQNLGDIKHIIIDIEPSFLPQVDTMGEEKKLSEVNPASKNAVIDEPFEEAEEIITKQIAGKLVEEDAESFVQEKPGIEVIDPAKEAMLRYQDMVKQKIEKNRRYPVWAKKEGIEGVVHLNFSVLLNGLSSDIMIIRSSGYNILDEEAINNIRMANPFPPIPENINAASIQMEVSIVYRLK